MKSKKILCKSQYSRMRSAIISLGLIISFLIPSFCGCNMLPADSGEITYTKPKAENVVLDAETGDYYVNNQLLLIAEEGVPKAWIKNLVKKYQGEIVGYIVITDDYEIRFPQAKTLEELNSIAGELKSNKYVHDVMIDYMHEIFIDSATPAPSRPEIPTPVAPVNDSEWLHETWDAENPDGKNWGVEAIDAMGAWEHFMEMKPVNVGIIDTMFDVNHEDLKDRFERVWNNPKSDAIDDAHGTHVAGTMAAGWNNKKGITGVMPKAKLYGYSVFGTDTNAIVEQKHLSGDMELKYALTLLITHNCKVINVSMGRLPSDENASIADKLAELESGAQSDAEVFGDFLAKLLKAEYDFLIIQAAGNDGIDAARYNGLFTGITNEEVKKHIIVVGAINHKEHINGTTIYNYADFSNYGEHVDIVAPGVKIHSTVPYSSYAYKSGTSMAAPHVSGTAAMCFAVNPGLTGARVKAIICNTADRPVQCGKAELENADRPTNSREYMRVYEILNAKAAVEKALETSGEVLSSGVPESTPQLTLEPTPQLTPESTPQLTLEPTSNPNINVPEGYDPNGYLKLRAFFEIEDENGVKNGDKLWTYTGDECFDDNTYNPDDPETWNYAADNFYPGIYWRKGENGIKYVSEIDLRIDFWSSGQLGAIVGKLDISGMGALEAVKFPDGNISELNTEGCSIKCLYCSSTLRKIDWHCDEEDIEIHLQSSGEGFVGIDYYSAYSGFKEIDNWYIEAVPMQDNTFIGWYDSNGNCVSTDLKCVFYVAENDCPDEERNACPPAGSHLNLEARFAAGLVTTPAPVASVTFHDPAFEAAFRKKYNIIGAITMDMILSYEELDLSGCGLVDITDAAMFKNLTKLDIGNNKIDNDDSISLAANALSELTKLTYLDFSANWFGLYSFDVIIDALSELPNLKKLDLSCCFIYELPDLSSLTNLECLILNANSISNITPISALTNLTSLDLSTQWQGSARQGSCPLTDITPISNMKNLVWLNLGDNDILDITPLSALTNLTYLNISDNGSYDPWEHTWSDQIEDISPLSGLTKLTELYIDGCGGEDWVPLISDISPLSGLTKLTKLHLGWNKISDISPLSVLTNLTELWLEDNDLTASTDVSPLFNLNLLETLSIKSGNELTQSQIDAIQSHLPNCTIN